MEVTTLYVKASQTTKSIREAVGFQISPVQGRYQLFLWRTRPVIRAFGPGWVYSFAYQFIS